MSEYMAGHLGIGDGGRETAHEEALKQIKTLLKEREVKYFNDTEDMTDEEYLEKIIDIVGGIDWKA